VSLAFRLTFGADRTLTDEEVDAALRKIVAHIRMTCAATLRGEL
jgi:phenylalanyl-tRNA synthetase beta subunit